MSEYVSLRIPIRVLAAFIFLQGILKSCSQAVHIRTWQRRLHHLRGLSLQAFSDLFQSGNYGLRDDHAACEKARLELPMWCSSTT